MIVVLDYIKFVMKRIIDWSVLIPILVGISIVYLLACFGLIPYPACKYIRIAFVVSPLISRKLLWGLFYFFPLTKFTKLIAREIKTRDDFRSAWSCYRQICHLITLKARKRGIYAGHYFLMLMLNEKLRSLQINQQANDFHKDKFYQEDLVFYTFAYQACNLVCSYDIRRHVGGATQMIERPLRQISFDPIFIKIIKDCYMDGGGFLSTLTLMLLIMICLRLPDGEKALVMEFLRGISHLEIGWLNRKVFETAIATVMIESLSPKEKLQELESELKSTKLESAADKWNFRNKVLASKISQLGLEHAD